jgi:hypothetical protein
MKEDIVRNVFVPGVWVHLVVDHEAKWKQQTAPHIPGWGAKRFYEFIVGDHRLCALVGVLPDAEGAVEVVLEAENSEPDLDHEEMLRQVLEEEGAPLQATIEKRVAAMDTDSLGYESPVEGRGQEEGDSEDSSGDDVEKEEDDDDEQRQ